MPRPYEVYRFMDPAAEAQIPPEIRSQFQRDDQGRVLWFSAASRDRSANKGLAPEYANLGHSVSHLANIGDIREERRRKRKERDETLARDAQPNKKASADRATGLVEEAADVKQAMLETVLANFAETLEQANKVFEEDIAGFREEKAAWEEEKNMVAKDVPKDQVSV
jgi:chromatin structure-remodeling complex subunit RSC1/2